jgi:hypothetical protein
LMSAAFRSSPGVTLAIEFIVRQLRLFLKELSMPESQFTELPLINRPSLSFR